MNRIKTLPSLIIFAFLVLTRFVIAQSDMSTDIISVRDGLSNNSISDIIQDKYGYIWLATADGINRYDGYKITIYKNIPGDTTSLPANSTYDLFEDSQGMLWISSIKGLVRYNRISNTFSSFRFSDSNAQYANLVLEIFEDSRKKLWVTTSDGTMEFVRDSEKFRRYDIMKTDNSIVPYVNFGGVINESNSGELYNASSSSYGLLKFDYDASLFIQIALKDNFLTRLRHKLYWEMIFDENNDLWLGAAEGLLKIDLTENRGYDYTPFKKRVIVNRFRDNAVKGLFIDRYQNMWVSTGRNGVFLFDTRKQNFEQLSEFSMTIGYEGIYEDNSGLLWLGSSRGVIKYDFDRKPFESFSFDDDNEENRSRFVVSFNRGIINNNMIWLGTTQGIALFDKTDNSLTQLPRELNTLSHLNTLGISDVLESNTGILWIATDGEGLYSFDLRSKKLQTYKSKNYDNSTLLSNRITNLAMDIHENLWVGTRRGLHLFKAGENKFTHVPSHRNRKYSASLISIIKDLRQKTKPLSSIIRVGDYADLAKEFVVRKDAKVVIYSMGEGSDGMWDFGWLESEKGDTIWSATDYEDTFHGSGTFKNRVKMGLLELKAGRYKLRYISDDSHSSQSYNDLPPQDSTYWGVQIYSLNNEEFQKIADYLKESIDKTYLAGNLISVIFPDSKNNMWIGTNNGFSKFDSSFHIENYTNISMDNKTLSNNSVNDIKEDLHGHIWIATDNGLNKFDPEQKTFSLIHEKDGLPSANLSAIEVDNQGNLWVSGIRGISKIELDENGDKTVIVNYDVKDGLQGFEFIRRSSFKNETGKLYFGGYDGFNAFYPANSNKTPPFLSFQNVKISNRSISQMEDFGFPDLNNLSELSLAHDQNDLSFEFASIHFSRPDKNRLMYKMDDADEDWIVTDRRFASYTNLRPGDYVFSLRGSNGDGIWSEETKSINIHISAPWYNNGFAYTIYIILFFGLLYGIRKFEMERQQKNARIKESQLRAEAAELQAKAAEAQNRVIQVENERKSKELEEARELQLSMLPQELPKLPQLDIAVYMKTATEVGGDYYDFNVSLDGTLTVVIGDATGHGMQAGTMVTAAKSLFNSYAPNPDILFSFSEITRCLKLMNLGKLSMCMTMLKIQGNKLYMSAAGMPPSFIFRKDTQVVEEHLLQGMPLGTMEKFSYKLKDTNLAPGDTILLLTDGLPELKNDEDELFGYKRVRNLFEEVAERTPEEIITNLKDRGSEWVNDADPDDDVTFVVIKVK